MIAGLHKNQNILMLENEYTTTTGFKPFIYGFSQTISKRRKFTGKVFVVLLCNASKIPQTLNLGLHYVLKAFPLDVDWTYIKRSEDNQDFFWIWNIRKGERNEIIRYLTQSSLDSNNVWHRLTFCPAKYLRWSFFVKIVNDFKLPKTQMCDSVFFMQLLSASQCHESAQEIALFFSYNLSGVHGHSFIHLIVH